jgi:hypothetical protein
MPHFTVVFNTDPDGASLVALIAESSILTRRLDRLREHPTAGAPPGGDGGA